MSLRARSYQRIPTRTVLTAWAACPKGTPAILMRDRLDVVFKDEEFADLFPKDGRPGLPPGQLALVSVLRFAENLSDRAAANAVRTRIDWKYALGLELDDPGFDHSVLCEFRARLTEAGLLRSRGRQRTDATHVLAAVRTLSRLEMVGESLRAALEQLAQADPDCLLPLVEPEWDKRYGRKVEIGKVPGGKARVTALAEAFGRDGQKILAAAWATDAPPRLRTLTQVEILRRVWVHHYYWDARGRLRWRDGRALPPASLRFDSPYDTDAHYCVKRDTGWSGYRTHFTETCTSELPEVVVHVATTIAPVQDGRLTAQIHDDLAAIDLTPDEHAVDAAYISPVQIERARRVHGITLLGLVAPDHSHQAKSGAGFDKAACLACPVRPQCTAAVSGPRSLALLPTRELHEIQQHNRLDQRTEHWQRRYAIRAGIEATLSQNVRAYGLRPTPNPLPRPAENTHRARPDRTGLQRHPHRRLDRRTDPSPAGTQPLPRPLHHSQLIPARSPTESWHCF